MNNLQDILYKQNKHKVLLVLQDLDASGKGGAVKYLFKPCDLPDIYPNSLKCSQKRSWCMTICGVQIKVPKLAKVDTFRAISIATA